jgi:hypothetical protein
MKPAAVPGMTFRKEKALKTANLMLASAATLVLSIAAAATSTTMYDVDEDRDGRPDRMLILEQSDALA